MFDQQMLDSLAKALSKLHREKRRAYSAAQSHIVNYSRDLILVDKMAELDEVVENPIKQPIKSNAKRACKLLAKFGRITLGLPHHLFEPTCIVHSV